MPLLSSSPLFIWSANSEGLAIRFSDRRRYQRAQEGSAREDDQLAFIRMQMLIECGAAEGLKDEAGIFIPTDDAVRLDAYTREGFCLPPYWPGGMRLKTEGVPQLSTFTARLGLVDEDSSVDWNWRLHGPILESTNSSYLPTAAQFAALRVFSEFINTAQRDELSNLSLLATLREAKTAGCRIDLEAYQDTIISHADELFLDAREDSGTGDLVLRPLVAGNFPDLDADWIEERISQLQAGSDRAVLRVGQTIVLLDPQQTAQARATAAKGRVPREQRRQFEDNPSAWLADHVFPDIEAEFSPRVTGVGVWKGGYQGANWEKTLDWFGARAEDIKSDQFKKDTEATEKEDGDPDIVLDTSPSPVVPLIIPNDEELGFGWRIKETLAVTKESVKPDFTRYARKPLPFQEEAVRWLLGHAKRAVNRRNGGGNGGGFGAGALLADDMGLGKTFSTLMFLAEWFDLWRKTLGQEPGAILIVAPLSLLENWKAEIEKSYRPEHQIFSRLIVAQADFDLAKVRRGVNSRDVAVPEKVEQYGLGFGDGTERSLDYPGGCVLTTYQTLRDYRFSFAKAEWSAAIFDEAQNIKNPNALQTIAAKSLKALFRITITGTPVENHLGDFWSIVDTAEPGPLGSFTEFKRNWIQRMTRERDRMFEIGQELRDHVGGLMLRRIKEETLEGLPVKTGGVDPIIVDMTAEQTALYNSVITANQSIDSENTDERQERRSRQLAALWQLRQISLHPDLLGGGTIPSARNRAAAREVLMRSGKLVWLLGCLERIRESNEKALVFCVQKRLQEALTQLLGLIFGINVPIINGDTKATSKRHQENTRLGLIDKFSAEPGFGICVLSPIAAGAGLNIVAANHVIHLERHWNPAKEDQATDRAYRIGQERPVVVYLPASKHPRLDSFDLILHRLLHKKRSLQSALGLVPPEVLSASDLIDEVFAQPGAGEGAEDYMDLKSALGLSWRLFEALIATMYEKSSQKVILTPGGSDHGCDVVVLGFGKDRENLLIQCKSTKHKELNSEVAVRDIEGARPFYEKYLGVKFDRRCLHTTAKKISRRTKSAAEICGVTVHCRSWLEEKLLEMKIRRSSILAADMNRTSVL